MWSSDCRLGCCFKKEQELARIRQEEWENRKKEERRLAAVKAENDRKRLMEDWEKKAKAAAEHIGLENHQVILNAVWKNDLPRYYTGWVKDEMTNFNFIWTLEYYREGKRNGFHIEWWEEQMTQVMSWSNGKHHGPITEWHRNGQIKTKGNNKEGSRDGVWTTWYDNGQKASESIWKKDISGKIVSAVAWKPNGEKCDKTRVVNGFGVWYEYNDDGTIDYRKRYSYGSQTIF